MNVVKLQIYSNMLETLFPYKMLTIPDFYRLHGEITTSYASLVNIVILWYVLIGKLVQYSSQMAAGRSIVI